MASIIQLQRQSSVISMKALAQARIANGIEKSEPQNTEKLPKSTKYLTTAAILFGNVTFGCAFCFYSPALETLRLKFNTTVDEISVIFSILLGSYCLGALASTPLYAIFNRQLSVISFLLLMSSSLILTPFCPSKYHFFALGSLLGFSIGAYDAAQVVWIVEMWQEDSGPLIQAQHFFYAVGSSIPAGLWAVVLKNKNADHSLGNGTFAYFPSSQAGNLTVTTNLVDLPYYIGGSFNVAAAIFQAGLFVFLRYRVPPMYEEEQKEEKEDGINWGKVRLVVLTGIFLGLYQAMEMSTLQFIPTFARYSPLKLNQSHAAVILSALTGSFALGRFLGIFIIMKCHPLLMLVGNLFLVFAGNSILLFLAPNNIYAFWASNILLGLGLSTMYASFCAFMEKHILFTNAVGAFMIVCGSPVAALYPMFVGSRIVANVVVICYSNYFSLVVCGFCVAAGWWWTRGGDEKRY